MAEMGRDLEDTCSTPGSSRVTTLPRIMSRWVLKDGGWRMQGWRLHDLPGQTVPGCSHCHSEKVFPDVQRKHPVFQFVPLPLVLALGTTEKSLSLSLLHPPPLHHFMPRYCFVVLVTLTNFQAWLLGVCDAESRKKYFNRLLMSWCIKREMNYVISTNFSLESIVTWGIRTRTKNFDTTTLCAN